MLFVGAATAFGLVSLLPLNVPPNKPLMYCNKTLISQTRIKLDDHIYSCVNEKVAISCPIILENKTVIDKCLSSRETMECGLEVPSTNLFCINGTLISHAPVVCNSTTVFYKTNEVTVLNCYRGKMLEIFSAFIPTTTKAPLTERQLSMGAQIHIFFMKLIGKGNILEKTSTSGDDLQLAERRWIPEALTLPPEPTTTGGPHKLMQKTWLE